VGIAPALALAGLQVPPPASHRRVHRRLRLHEASSLIIEADGGQHDQSSADAQRTAWLERRGWRVVRFWNNDILTNSEGVLTTILDALRDG
jgi:hypothetical protein